MEIGRRASAMCPPSVERPTVADRTAGLLRSNSLLLLPLLSLLFVYRLWRSRGKDPERRPIAPAYAPPEGMTPAEVGTLVDNRPDTRDIIASVVDLAVRGYLRIEETEESKFFGLSSSNSFDFVLLKPRDAWQELRSHERAVLTGIFKHGSRVSLAARTQGPSTLKGPIPAPLQSILLHCRRHSETVSARPPPLGERHLRGVCSNLTIDLRLAPAQAGGHQLSDGSSPAHSAAPRLIDHVSPAHQDISHRKRHLVMHSVKNLRHDIRECRGDLLGERRMLLRTSLDPASVVPICTQKMLLNRALSCPGAYGLHRCAFQLLLSSAPLLHPRLQIST